jgi:hypothetical protein
MLGKRLSLLYASFVMTLLGGCGVSAPPGRSVQHRGGGVVVPSRVPKEDSSGVEAMPVTPTGTLPVLPEDQTKDLDPVPWQLMGVQDGGRRIALSVQMSPRLLKGVRIMETPDEVKLTVYGAKLPDGPRAAMSIRTFTTVVLPQPLGARQLRGSEEGP